MPRTTMLKAVLQRNSLNMDRVPSVPPNLVLVKMLVENLRALNPAVNTVALNELVSLLDTINGGPVRTITMNGTIDDVRYMIQDAMTSLIRSVEEERPDFSARLNAIDWKTLFGISSFPVDINITPASDEDSGSGSTKSELGE